MPDLNNKPGAVVAAADRDAALLAWQSGAATPESVARLLRRSARTAADNANLGAVLRAAGDVTGAEAAYRQAIALDPAFAPAHYNLGNLQADTHKLDLAEHSYRSATALRPDYAAAWNGLGLVLQRLHRHADAVQAFRSAATHAPNWAEAYANLGVALLALEQYEPAQQALRAALAIDPRHPAAHGNLGALLIRAGIAIEAEAACRAAIALAPTEHRWHANLAVALQMQARHEAAEACYRQALALCPDYAGGHGNLLFALNYRADLTAEAIFAEYRQWHAAHARPLAPPEPTFPAADLGRRRLRIGYVSPDFRQHAVALFAEPLLAAHDKSRVEVFCYAEVAREDAVTARFRALADHWRPTAGSTDAEVADMIRRDEIDVLIDLGGHTAASRLLVFARRPAPVQIATMLGHGYTTGLREMDAFLADETLAPGGSEALFSERLIRLPRIPLVYQPPAGMPPVSPAPRLRNGHVTFGHFGRPERLNGSVVAAWARILLRVPGSRLVLNNRSFTEAAFRARFAAAFAAHGVEPDQVEMVFTAPQQTTWAAYGQIDIALDPFPHNAGTTTIEALWQGVPVLTLADRPSVGRIGAAILSAAGLDDWIASDVDTYVARAVAAANDPDALAQLRQILRPMIAASPLRDAPGLARAVEATGRTLRDAADRLPRARTLFHAGDLTGALAEADRILSGDPGHPAAAHIAGLIAYQGNQLQKADGLLQIATSAARDDAEPHANHAAILRKLGRLAEAEQAARTALSIAPDRSETHNNLGNILRDAGRYAESLDAFAEALRLSPGFADAWANLAWVQSLTGQAQQAEHSARQAIRHDPRNANGHNNLGLALMRQSRLREAEAALRQALALRPDFALAHSNILFCLNYRDDLPPQAIFGEYRNWDERHARPFAPATPAFDLDRTPGRRLRVGYVSPDFRTHAVALFAEPLLANHDHGAVELFCYAELAAGDATTARFQAMADHWRCTVGLSDDAVAARIRRDRIDVLIDLAGHTAGNRLQVFARKPAPVQIEFMLGHGYTSGLSAMDAFIADDALAPPGSDALFSEQVVRLPRIPLAYRPPCDMPPVARLPAAENGVITFGYFGRTVRLNDKVVETWSRILHTVPGARLVLNNGPLAEAAGRAHMAARFAAHGIGPDRLDLICTAPQPRTWDAYGAIDIALDPFPHNAGTTTIEALWMGVPVVTLADRPTVGRFGAAILHALDMDDWITADTDGYVARAVTAARDLAALAQCRATLRPRFAASPLHDAPGLARAMESAYRGLWDTWRRRGVMDPKALYGAGQHEAAGTLAARMLADDPHHPGALHVLATQAFGSGDVDRALSLLHQAPPRADILTDRGVMLRAAGRRDEAEQCYRQALALDPGLVPALGNLGNVLLDQGRARDAVAAFNQALERAPDLPWLLRGKALALLALTAAGEAEALLRRAVHVAPEDAEAHETLGALLGQSGRPIEAEHHHRTALPGLKDKHRGYGNLAVVLQTQGRHQEAEHCYRAALAHNPSYASGHGNLLFALNYRDDLTPEAILAEYRRWDQQHAGPLQPAAPLFDLDLTPGRRLRVGYVSPDFRRHAASFFSEPLIAAHDKAAVEVFCYAEVPVEDDVTARFHALADHWRRTTGMSNDDVADLIRRDRIDVLVDMAGHTSGNRLLVFARRPAPVQVEYILGHGGTSGMTAMDAFLADDALAPRGADALFSEELIRLPRIPLVYQPPAEMPRIASPPAPRNGHTTFGYFGRVERLNDRVISTWARILRGVPGSRLVLNSLPFQEAAFRERMARRFAAYGIAEQRLRLIHTAPQPVTWEAYAQIDIALDPFPHNAGTTTIEALYQGVPVLTRADRPPVGRFGASILRAVGLNDWIASDDDTYVAKAIAASAAPDVLATLQAELRHRMSTSPLMDAAGLARLMEHTYRMLWERWRVSCTLPLAAE